MTQPTLALATALSAATLAIKAGHMTHDTSTPTLNVDGVSHAETLIRAGKVNTGEWAWTDSDAATLLGPEQKWTEYATWFLGEDNGYGEQTAERYKYPFGKGGEVYTRALNAIRTQATRQGATGINDAASKLIGMINKGAA